MIIDKDLVLELDMAMPNDTEADATTTRDLKAAGVGGSGSLWATAIVTTKPTAGTGVQAKFYFSANDSDWEDVFTGDEIAIADATVGKVLACFALPPDVLRYIKGALKSSGDCSTGKASLLIAHEPVKSL
ncbi:MAG: hypothetical protein JXQ30_08740 [Spirochaetes bacterium]|nr:hypothetical protein [Spirochaetota bacterium]